MPRRKAKDILSRLCSAERGQVLAVLLRRHPDLREEADAIAEDLIDDVDVEAVADDLADLVSSIGLDELNSRAGSTSWGYVEPSEAAWELLEESIEDVQRDMERRAEEKRAEGWAEKLQRTVDQAASAKQRRRK